jgi:hypothetical protein
MAEAVQALDERTLTGVGTALPHSALGYAELGWAVLPLHTRDAEGVCSCDAGRSCPRPGKHQRARHGVKDAATDPDTICEWWAGWPDANIGVATGQAGGLVVLDVHPRHGGDDSLRRLIDQRGDLPPTAEALTGGGGRHLYLRHDGGPSRRDVWGGAGTRASICRRTAPTSWRRRPGTPAGARTAGRTPTLQARSRSPSFQVG